MDLVMFEFGVNRADNGDVAFELNIMLRRVMAMLSRISAMLRFALRCAAFALHNAAPRSDTQSCVLQRAQLRNAASAAAFSATSPKYDAAS